MYSICTYAIEYCFMHILCTLGRLALVVTWTPIIKQPLDYGIIPILHASIILLAEYRCFRQ